MPYEKLFDKDEVWFAVAWIIGYVVCFSAADALSEAMGTAKLVTVSAGLLLSLLLFGFVWKNRLQTHFGLCAMKGKLREYLYLLPWS